jgi:ATP-dependent Clp protease ATP-binding subunit ClpC
MHRFPVLVWEDWTGSFSARLIDDEGNFGSSLAGFGRTAREALSQLKEYLVWSFDHEQWRSVPDFHDPRITEFRVEVRPEYQVKNRVYPCDEPIPLRVAAVHGRQESGMLVCAVPMLGLQFYYYESTALRRLVNTYVQEALKGKTPQQLSRYLFPKRLWLEEIAVAGGRRGVVAEKSIEVANLKMSADPLNSDQMRRGFSRAYGRERQVSELALMLIRERANVLLVGEVGVGKTSILIDAVREVERTSRPRNSEASKEGAAQVSRFWTSSAARLIAGMKYLGQWEERCEKVIEDLARIEGVIAFEDLLELVRTGGATTNTSIASFLLPFIQRGELRVISETTPAGLDACRRLLPGFADAFRIFQVPSFTQPEALATLQAYCAALERNQAAWIDNDGRRLICRLFQRFLPYEAFPGKTVNFTSRLYERAKTAKLSEITNDVIIDSFVKLTGLPELFLRDEVTLLEDDVRAFFESEVIGQDEACQVATGTVLTFKAGLNDPARPLSVLFFTGPTGVGKTELARSLARLLFGGVEDSERFVRLDMSEYSSPGSAERLVSRASGETSEFINRMRRQPFAVVLLDEVEKADEGVFDVLLSVFDEGRLTDRFGRTTYFRSAVIVMTSNLGAASSDPPGFNLQLAQAASTYDRAAQTFFRPEFYNRIDRIVSFRALGRDSIRRIVVKELQSLNTREGMEKRNLRLAWTERLVDHLVGVGFTTRLGARPLQRAIEQQIVTQLAFFLNRKPQLRETQLTVDYDPEQQKIAISHAYPSR